MLEGGDFFAGDVAVAAGGEGAEFDIGDGDAAEFVDVMSGGEEGFAKCVLASADSLHFPPAGGHAFGAGEFDGGAAFEFANSSRIGRWINFAEINLAEIVGAHDAIGEFTVIGEEKEAGGVIFEASDGENASGEAAEEIGDGFAAFGIAQSGDDGVGLVQRDVNLGLGVAGADAEEFAGDADVVAGGVGFGAELGDDMAVDGDLSRGDEGLGVAAGGHSGAGDDFLQAFLHVRTDQS